MGGHISELGHAVLWRCLVLALREDRTGQHHVKQPTAGFCLG